MKPIFTLFILAAFVSLTSCKESQRAPVTKLVAQIQRADYEGDRAALGRLYLDLAPFADDQELGVKVRYWLGSPSGAEHLMDSTTQWPPASYNRIFSRQ